MPCKAVIFDLDGTLLDTLADLHDAVNHTLRTLSLPEITREQTRAYVGNGIRCLLRQALPISQQERTDEALAVFLPYYNAHMQDKTVPYPGVPKLLDELRRRSIRTAVLSNKNDAPVKALCSRWFPQLDVALGARPDMAQKPAPDGAFVILNSLGVTAKETVYVGDSEVDAATAQNAGLRLIAVDWGFRNKETLQQAGAQIIVSDTAALLHTVLTL